MLFSSSDEEVGALINQYKDYAREFEKNLLMMHIKSDGHLSIQDVYSMPYKVREIYIEANNEFVEEQKKNMKSS